MVSSPALQHLCCEIIEEYYGSFSRALFHCLCQDGRLKATQIAQKCHLPLRQVQAGLASLIQLKVINHHALGDSPSTYSPNLQNTYNILRFGKLTQTAFMRHGKLAADIVETVCQLGFATIGEVSHRLLSSNQDLESQSQRVIEGCIQRLLQDGFLRHVRSAHLRDPYDAQRDVEYASTTFANLAKLSGTKAKQEHAARVVADYRKAVSTEERENGYVNDTFLTNRKQTPNGTSNANLKTNLQDPLKTLIDVNPYKLVSVVQGQRLTELAVKSYDETTKSILRCLVEKASTSDPWNKHSLGQTFLVDVNSLTEKVNSERRMRSSMNETERPIANGHSEIKKHACCKVGDVQRRLKTMADGPFRIFLHAGSVDSEWIVDKMELDFFLQQEETLRVISSRLEDPAPRILRILVEKGKLEEKTLQEISLLGAKELRQCLSLLKQVGCLDLQEVPRNQQRQPNHTVFLWFYDNKRTSALVLESIYATIERLVQYLKDERRSISATLVKFGGKEISKIADHGLEEVEYNLYRRYGRLENWIWAEISRLDSTVAILQDG